MIYLLATAREEGLYYLKRMFPEEPTTGRGNVRIATMVHHLFGVAHADYIKVGEFPQGEKGRRVLWAAQVNCGKDAQRHAVIQGARR